MALLIRDVELLLAVHDFQLRVLKSALGHDIPLPAAVGALQPGSSDSDQAAVVDEMRRWLNVLDQAITAPMVRDALKDQTPPPPTSVFLLRYFATKQLHTESDRDKADYVVSYLFRTPVPDGAWDGTGDIFGSPKAAPSFEAALLRMLELQTVPPLPEEHAQLVREFHFMHEELEDVRFFDALIDSGLMQRARDIKQALGKSFYHPHVLAIVATYNVYFGVRFDRLFHEATRQIKEYAQRVVAEGGSIMTRVDGDVLVKQLNDVEEDEILKSDYGKAQDQFRNLSKYKKAVDVRRGTREAMVRATVLAGRPTSPDSAPTPPAGLDPLLTPLAGASSGSLTASLEDTRVHEMRASIRNFVRAADPQKAQVVPLRHGNMTLTPAEADAFRTDYGAEKSFRADLAAAITYIVAVIGRMDSEMIEFKMKRNSSYLWKPHADSLTHLLNFANEGIDKAEKVALVAEQRGLKERVATLKESVEKLRQEIQMVAKLLQTVGSNQASQY